MLKLLVAATAGLVVALQAASAQPAHAPTARAQAEARQYLTICTSEPRPYELPCEAAQQEFLRNYQQAKAGDYQGQRNVAWSLNHQTAGIQANTIQGCAWRRVILNQGHARANPLDANQLRIECANLSPEEQQAVAARAAQLLQEIRTAPARMPPPRPAPPPHRGPLDDRAEPITGN